MTKAEIKKRVNAVKSLGNYSKSPPTAGLVTHYKSIIRTKDAHIVCSVYERSGMANVYIINHKSLLEGPLVLSRYKVPIEDAAKLISKHLKIYLELKYSKIGKLARK